MASDDKDRKISPRNREIKTQKQAVINATIGVTDESVMQKLSFDDIRDLIGL